MSAPALRRRNVPVPTATHCPYCSLQCGILMVAGNRPATLGAKSDVHVPLRVVEDLEGGTAIELYIAAPQGLTGSVIVDVGLVEV